MCAVSNMCESCEYCWYTYYVNAICYAFLNPLHILILAAECNSSCCRCLSPSSCPKSRSHACNWWIDFICVLYLRWAYLPESCMCCTYACNCTHAVCIATATTGAETDCPYLCFAHDFTSIALVSVWICIAPWSSLKDQDLEPKTKRWLLLKRQVQEEALTWGVVTAFFLPFGGVLPC